MKAIDTVYKGYRFRSRLEARWAVFFATLGVEWTYEAEGYELPSGWYLPDFFLPKHEIFVEVKPKTFGTQHDGVLSRAALYSQSSDADIRRALDLANATGLPVKFACGDPVDEFYRDGYWFDYPRHVICPTEDDRLKHAAYTREEALQRTLALSGHGLEHAAFAARQARFEHGAR
ncbi:endonuclease I protein [Rhizobium phage RHph_N65]|nr:endonuclease I protein [Rhizobium phage RHph_N65]